MSWIQTHSGQAFDLANPTPAMVNLPDIAHALGHICRFTGHTSMPYSVAHHSLLVADLVEPEHRLQALLHDAHEAYIGDMSTPLKWLMPTEYRVVEERVWLAVAAAFRIDPVLHPSVKQADRIMLMTERRDLLAPCDHRWAEEYEAVPAREKQIDVHQLNFGAQDAWAFQRAVGDELQKRRAAA